MGFAGIAVGAAMVRIKLLILRSSEVNVYMNCAALGCRKTIHNKYMHFVIFFKYQCAIHNKCN